MKINDLQRKKNFNKRTDNAILRERSKIKFPNCIGLFPECTNVTADNIIDDCYKCPYFDKKFVKEENEMVIVKKLEPTDYSAERTAAINEVVPNTKEVETNQKCNSGSKHQPELDILAQDVIDFLRSKKIDATKYSVVLSRAYRLNKNGI